MTFFKIFFKTKAALSSVRCERPAGCIVPMATSGLGLLASSYGDDSDDAETGEPAAAASTAIVVNAAPTVGEDMPNGHQLGMWNAIQDDRQKKGKVVYQNPQYEEMWAPQQGPSLTVHEQRAAGLKAKSSFVGHAAHYHPSSDFAFEEQYHTFNAYGFAADPSTAGHHGQGLAPRAGVVGDRDRWAEARGQSVFSGRGALESKMEEQRKRLRLDESYAAIPHAEPEISAEQAAAIAAKHKKEKQERDGRGDTEEPSAMEETSVFHGSNQKDYQGRSWLHPPTDLRVDDEHECFIPKKWTHTWSGHTKGVAAIRWFPKTGHMLFSAGMDSKVKIWDVYNSKKCMRTYMGHAAAVRDLCLSNDGSRFVSCSYDRYLKLWDTETGQCISAFTNRKLPFCCVLHPEEQHSLLAGCSNKHIVQYDMRSGKVEQVYDQHLAAVNTITFCEENRRFATTADDKKMLIWEYGIPVPIKHISDPTMHSMPAVTKTPNDKWLLCTNLDNQITCYSASDRFKLNRKKCFKGHVVAGYACQPGVSPDGNFVMSGDTDGRLWFWDWKSCKVFRKIKCHDQVCIQALWHPIEPSSVATCSWDGTIKFWD
jgi:pre-mRNA-processing factor 17